MYRLSAARHESFKLVLDLLTAGFLRTARLRCQFTCICLWCPQSSLEGGLYINPRSTRGGRRTAGTGGKRRRNSVGEIAFFAGNSLARLAQELQ